MRILTILIFTFMLAACVSNQKRNQYTQNPYSNPLPAYSNNRVVQPLVRPTSPPVNSVLDELRQKAEQGDVTAQNKLGVMYVDGKGNVVKNNVEAEKWFRMAAESGDAAAQTNLAAMEEAKQNHTEAMSWYSKSAKQGYALGQANLAKMYLDKKNYTEAAKWFRKAADQGYADAQIVLGGMYFQGQGVKKDYEVAYKWFSTAAAQGNPQAKEAMSLLQRKMSKAQLERVCDLKENALVTIFSSSDMGPTPCNLLAIHKDAAKVVKDSMMKRNWQE